MKRYKFSLEKVLKYRGHLQKKEQDALARLHAELNSLLDEEKELVSRYENAKREYERLSAAGMRVIDTAVMLNHIESIRKQIVLQKAKFSEKGLEIENQTKILVAVTREKRTVEKLRDKKLEIYRNEKSKKEEKFIEDFIANRKSIAI